MFDNLTVMSRIPDNTWLARLRPGNFIFLSKEKEFGIVEWEYVGDLNTIYLGRIGFRRFTNNQWKNETWMVSSDGKGGNLSQLFMPVEGHVPTQTPPLPKSELDQLKKKIQYLEEKLEALEVDLSDLLNKDSSNLTQQFQIVKNTNKVFEIGSDKILNL